MASRSRAGGAASHDEEVAAERREAARLLLAHGLATATGPHADGFRLVRRHAEPLKVLFQQHLGYRLIVEAGFARLVKPGLGPASGRRLVRSTGVPFTPHTYAYLTLALTVLVTASEQMLLSQLVAGIRTAAVDAGVELAEPDRQSERRTIAAALRQLVEWGVLGEVDGTVLGYVDDEKKDALLAVDREIARNLVVGPVRAARTPTDLIMRAAEAGPGGPRHAVRRLLVETPAVYLDDLIPDERGWLRRQQRREQRIFDDQFGLDLEIRAEGALLVDPAEAMSDLTFPATGTVAQAALLVVGRLAERLRPTDDGPPGFGARLTIGVPVPDDLLDRTVAEVTAEYAGPCGWARLYVDDPAALRREVCALLVAMRLLAPADARLRGDRPPTAAPDAGPEPADDVGGHDDGDGGGEDDDDAARDDDELAAGPTTTSGRRVADTAGARGTGGAAGGGWVLLAAAARFRPVPGSTGAAKPGRVPPTRTTKKTTRARRPTEGEKLW